MGPLDGPSQSGSARENEGNLSGHQTVALFGRKQNHPQSVA
jgi:hypothetical protein